MCGGGIAKDCVDSKSTGLSVFGFSYNPVYYKLHAIDRVIVVGVMV